MSAAIAVEPHRWETDGGKLLHLNLLQGEVEKSFELGSSSGQCAAFSPDGSRLVTGNSYALDLWDTGTGKKLATLQDREIQWSAACSPDGRYVISGGRGKVNLWDVQRRQKVRFFDTEEIFYIQTLAFSPDNRHFAAYPSAAGQSLQVFQIPRLD